MSKVKEIYEVMKKAVEEGNGELDCFGVDNLGSSYGVSTYGILKTSKNIRSGPLVQYDEKKVFLTFHVDY